MDNVKEIIVIAIGASLVYNFVLARFLGLCPFIGVSTKTSSAFGMGLAVTFVMTLASVVTFLLYTYILHVGDPAASPNLIYRLWPDVFEYTNAAGEVQKDPMVLERVLRTGSYILVIASLVQLVELALRKVSPALYQALGIYLPLITTNCAVMGVALLNTTDAAVPMNLATVTAQGFFAGVGFTIAMLLMSGIREALDVADVPESLRGTPIAFVCTSLMALSFLGFSGMV